ncbi:MAG: hypothetical protein OEN22_03985 [Gammaproteobacteria bacterium]|nr:hypothetical protein [Gammaproteobacteria bacterium]
MLRSLSLDNLEPLPADTSNAVADDPVAADFGHELFFDTRLSSNGGIACATCHQPERRFTDGLQKGVAIGTSKRNTPSIVGAAYSPWLYWDGRRDSLWSQALAPLEDTAEHGSSREQIVQVIATDPSYRATYESLFGPLPDRIDRDAIDRVFANIGKAIAAYERLLLPAPSRFDRYVEAVVTGDVQAQAEMFSAEEVNGLRLYIGAANCTQCHNGPLLTNNEFHNTGVIAFPGDVPDKGRVTGVREVLNNPFNCRSEFNDAANADCAELEFVRTGPELVGSFRTPSLRNLEFTAPFMHKGQLGTLADVLRHYNDAPPAMIGHSELAPLKLSHRELQDLEAFLHTLDAPLKTAVEWLQPPD